MSPHTCHNDYYQKINKQQVLERMWRKREPLYTVGGNVDWYRHCGKQYGGTKKKLKMKRPY